MDPPGTDARHPTGNVLLPANTNYAKAGRAAPPRNHLGDRGQTGRCPGRGTTDPGTPRRCSNGLSPPREQAPHHRGLSFDAFSATRPAGDLRGRKRTELGDVFIRAQATGRPGKKTLHGSNAQVRRPGSCRRRGAVTGGTCGGRSRRTCPCEPPTHYRQATPAFHLAASALLTGAKPTTHRKPSPALDCPIRNLAGIP